MVPTNKKELKEFETRMLVIIGQEECGCRYKLKMDEMADYRHFTLRAISMVGEIYPKAKFAREITRESLGLIYRYFDKKLEG